MQSVSSRIWTRVAVSISLNDNHYTTGCFLLYMNHWTKWYEIKWYVLDTGLRDDIEVFIQEVVTKRN